uniref:NADH-ubiquinone oxidoreductase chain 3 n=1 Tax=Archipsocus nomas TaxID=239250 RepID=A0A343QCF5_9NEOP|nr:NADH dehydrogenase subunit 3 [Archipsocus nomas]ATU07102.1 NADH dehydrogenase subunit 3 [Archipsocus nomas]
MTSLLINFILIMLISNIMMILCLFISKKSNYEREKASPFECGFDPKSSPRSSFSLRFFLISIIFLIFDVEIILILPSIINMLFIHSFTWMYTTGLFMIILLLGLLHEWNLGILEWTN